MGMYQIWRDSEKHDLIRKLNIFLSHIFQSKNSDKNTKNEDNYKIYQLVNTNILMNVI